MIFTGESVKNNCYCLVLKNPINRYHARNNSGVIMDWLLVAMVAAFLVGFIKGGLLVAVCLSKKTTKIKPR